MGTDHLNSCAIHKSELSHSFFVIQKAKHLHQCRQWLGTGPGLHFRQCISLYRIRYLAPHFLHFSRYSELVCHSDKGRTNDSMKAGLYWPQMAHHLYSTVRDRRSCLHNRASEKNTGSLDYPPGLVSRQWRHVQIWAYPKTKQNS